MFGMIRSALGHASFPVTKSFTMSTITRASFRLVPPPAYGAAGINIAAGGAGAGRFISRAALPIPGWLGEGRRGVCERGPGPRTREGCGRRVYRGRLREAPRRVPRRRAVRANPRPPRGAARRRGRHDPPGPQNRRAPAAPRRRAGPEAPAGNARDSLLRIRPAGQAVRTRGGPLRPGDRAPPAGGGGRTAHDGTPPSGPPHVLRHPRARGERDARHRAVSRGPRGGLRPRAGRRGGTPREGGGGDLRNPLGRPRDDADRLVHREVRPEAPRRAGPPGGDRGRRDLHGRDRGPGGEGNESTGSEARPRRRPSWALRGERV